MDNCNCTYSNRINYCLASEDEFFNSLEEIKQYAMLMGNNHLRTMIENTIKNGFKISK